MEFNLTLSNLQRLVEESSIDSPQRIEDLAEPSGIQTPFPYRSTDLVTLRRDLTEIFMAVDGEVNASSIKWQPIDAKASELIHSRLRDLPRDIAMSKGFWRYMSAYCSKAVCKRYGYIDIKVDFDKRHFGEEIFNSLLPRLWFRAELSYDKNAEDPYWLTKKGVSDFWSSFVLRRIYAQSKPLVRALVKYFFNPDSVRFMREDEQLTTLEAFRLIGPAVRRQHSLSPFEIMSEADCTNALDLLASELSITRIE